MHLIRFVDVRLYFEQPQRLLLFLYPRAARLFFLCPLPRR
nr:MAG TPA: hypothetical protein [Caudoviricetes sp.]